MNSWRFTYLSTGPFDERSGYEAVLGVLGIIMQQIQLGDVYAARESMQSGYDSGTKILVLADEMELIFLKDFTIEVLDTVRDI